ncbi:MAG: pilus (MSHA type) biogenesis protein MshL [Methylophilaceae bacterium]
MPLVLVVSAVLAACAHQSKVPPSEGHIGSQTDVAAAQPAKPNPANPNVVQAPIPKPVRSSPVLPPPRATKKAQTYSVVVNEVPVKEILFALARESKINVDIHPSIQGRATMNAVDQTLPAILERLSRQVDLTYKMDGNVLIITPDQPVLRIYKIDYVNMNRDTEGFIGSATEISSTGRAASTGGSLNSNGGGVNNSSRTSVTSKAQNHLWESLIQNIKELLAETDKEVIVKRFGTLAEKGANNESVSSGELEAIAEQNKAEAEQLDEQRSEYKTLFAANVIANPETGVISVRATNKQHEKVQEFIDRVMASASKQVLIEATIVEVQLNDSFQAGIDWSRLNNSATNSGFVFGQTLGSKGVGFSPNVNFNSNTGTGNRFTQGGTNALGVSSTAGFVAGYLNPVSAIGNIAASITLLKKFGDTKVLSSPKLMVLNNQTAVLKVVNNIVYFTVEAQQSQGSVGGGILSTVTTTPNTVPVGVVMSVTPQINNTDNVNINVRPTISSVIGFKPDPNPNLTIESLIPEIQVREMESVLQISSGNTAVLGGLMQDEIRRNTDKVPGLSDVPGVGKVFTGKNDANRKTELVIFLRPTVIKNASLESDELSSFKKYLPAQQLQKALDEAN